MLEAFDSIIQRLLNEKTPSLRGTIDQLLQDTLEIIQKMMDNKTYSNIFDTYLKNESLYYSSTKANQITQNNSEILIEKLKQRKILYE